MAQGRPRLRCCTAARGKDLGQQRVQGDNHLLEAQSLVSLSITRSLHRPAEACRHAARTTRVETTPARSGRGSFQHLASWAASYRRCSPGFSKGFAPHIWSAGQSAPQGVLFYLRQYIVRVQSHCSQALAFELCGLEKECLCPVLHCYACANRSNRLRCAKRQRLIWKRVHQSRKGSVSFMREDTGRRGDWVSIQRTEEAVQKRSWLADDCNEHVVRYSA